MLMPQDIPRAIENLKTTAVQKQKLMGKVITENSIIFGETRVYFEEIKTTVLEQQSQSGFA